MSPAFQIFGVGIYDIDQDRGRMRRVLYNSLHPTQIKVIVKSETKAEV